MTEEHPVAGLVAYRAVRDRLHELRWYVLDDHDAATDREIRLTLRPWEPEPGAGRDDPA